MKKSGHLFKIAAQLQWANPEIGKRADRIQMLIFEKSSRKQKAESEKTQKGRMKSSKAERENIQSRAKIMQLNFMILL